MNRYFAQGLAEDLLTDKQILFLCETRDGIRAAMDCVVAVLHDKGFDRRHFTVRRTNGGESIRLNPNLGSGNIKFSSVRSSLRGLSPEIVVIDADDYGLSYEWWRELELVTACGAEVIRR